MGMYMYVTESDRVKKRMVEDIEVNQLFQEVLKLCPSLMIDTYDHFYKAKEGWFFKKTFVSTGYNLYHETLAHDGTAYQAMYLRAGNKETIIKYLNALKDGANLYRSGLAQSPTL